MSRVPSRGRGQLEARRFARLVTESIRDAQGIETAKPPKRGAGSARKGESPVAAGDAP